MLGLVLRFTQADLEILLAVERISIIIISVLAVVLVFRKSHDPKCYARILTAIGFVPIAIFEIFIVYTQFGLRSVLGQYFVAPGVVVGVSGLLLQLTRERKLHEIARQTIREQIE